MTPATYIKGILKNNISELSYLSVDHIHTFFIPSSDQSTDDPILVISEVPDGEREFGNDILVKKGKRIQIEFYYPKDYSGDMASIEKNVEDLLLSNKVYCFSDAGHVITPDSKNIINTMKFNYIEEVI